MEKYVEIKKENGILRGMLHIPETGPGDTKFPGVILYHGFTGNRLEPRFIFVRFSRLLASYGIASVRFDFMHSGESDGSFEKMTFSGEIDDAEDILDYFSSLDMIDKGNIFLLGLSMGGSIAGCIAGKNKERIKGLILWSPAGDMSRYIEEREKQIHDGTITDDPLDVSGLRLGEEFITDVKKIHVFELTAPYTGPVTIIHGTDDESVPPAVSQKYMKIFEGRSSLTMIEGADHTYQGIKWSKKLFTTTLNSIKELLS